MTACLEAFPVLEHQEDCFGAHLTICLHVYFTFVGLRLPSTPVYMHTCGKSYCICSSMHILCLSVPHCYIMESVQPAFH